MTKLEFKLFDNRVRCVSCGRPIKINEFGGITTVDGKKALFHNKILCYLPIMRKTEQ